jgi:hypothetical protein
MILRLVPAEVLARQMSALYLPQSHVFQPACKNMLIVERAEFQGEYGEITSVLEGQSSTLLPLKDLNRVCFICT